MISALSKARRRRSPAVRARCRSSASGSEASPQGQRSVAASADWPESGRSASRHSSVGNSAARAAPGSMRHSEPFRVRRNPACSTRASSRAMARRLRGRCERRYPLPAAAYRCRRYRQRDFWPRRRPRHRRPRPAGRARRAIPRGGRCPGPLRLLPRAPTRELCGSGRSASARPAGSAASRLYRQ